MLDYNYTFDLFSLFILLGIGQCIFIILIIFFKQINRKTSNTYLALLLFALALISVEVFLCHTKLMLNVIFLFDFSSSLLFIVGPLLFLYIKCSLFNIKGKEFYHFIIFFLYLFYTLFYHLQPEAIKYNIYIYSYNIDLPQREAISFIAIDPLGIKNHLIPLAILHWISYCVLSLLLVKKYFKNQELNILSIKRAEMKWIRDVVLIFLIGALLISALILSTILSTTNYLAVVAITIMVYFISFKLVLNPKILIFNYINPTPVKKYYKSSLSSKQKKELLVKIKSIMEEDKLFCDNLITLSKIAKKIGASNNQVSQIINECMDMNFYEMLANYRINEAISIYQNTENITVEDLVYQVGYNSRTAFNNAFKKIKNKPPSEYLRELKSEKA